MRQVQRWRQVRSSASCFDNSDAGTQNLSYTGDYFNNTLLIGVQFGNNTFLNGHIQEIIIYPTDQIANRTGIETNINTEYDIYEPINNVVFGRVGENSGLTFTTPPGKFFTSVDFASYGNSSGVNGDYVIGSCNASLSQTIVEGYLLGKTGTITIPATNAVFGDPCSGTAKNLAVKATLT